MPAYSEYVDGFSDGFATSASPRVMKSSNPTRSSGTFPARSIGSLRRGLFLFWYETPGAREPAAC